MAITWKTDDKAVQRYFTRMGRRALDFRKILKYAQRELEKANIRNFASRGTESGAPWLPLDNEYSRWKLSQYGPRSLMVASGSLRNSLTNFRAGVADVGRTRATFGTDLSYAKFHQFGTTKMPPRKIVFVPRGFAKDLAEEVGDYLVHDSGPRHVTEFFRR